MRRVRGQERFAVVVADRDGRRARRLAVATENSVLLWSPDSARVLWSTFYLRLTTARRRSRAPIVGDDGREPRLGIDGGAGQDGMAAMSS
jgi:hypothetical protein